MKKRFAFSGGVLAAIFLLCLTGSVTAGDKGDKIVPEMNIKASKIIRVHYVGGISPAELTIEPGTTVIWLNDSRTPVELQFEGKQVTMACKSPVHFIVDENGSFISDRIPQGSVASLCFVEKGEFNYVMNKAATQATSQEQRGSGNFKGKIIVK